MRPIVDIIADVVTDMKPTISALAAVVSGGGATVTVGSMEAITLNRLFVGEKMKLTYTSSVVYGTIASISTDSFIITLTGTTKAQPPTAIEVVLNYHYGHPMEIVGIFSEMTKKNTVKKEMFPALCVMLDIPEDYTLNGYEADCTLHVVILTDTKPTFTAADRKTYSFIPILQPWYEKFIYRLRYSKQISPDYPSHKKTDRYFWGKSGLYGNTSNVFNDFIDAIEIENLKVKIFKTE